MPVPLVELLSAGIVALYLTHRCREAPRALPVLFRYLTVAAAAFLGEDSCIRLYGFYHYAPAWTLFLDQVPLLVALIWPAVIDSAWSIARPLVASPRRAALLAAGIVAADAPLIEPIAVRAGLWEWHRPGLFGVPVVGILGWGFFALAALTSAYASAAAGLHARLGLGILRVIPIAVVGTSSTSAATANRIKARPNPLSTSANRASSTLGIWEQSAGMPSPTSASRISMPPYTASGRRSRSANRPPR